MDEHLTNEGGGGGDDTDILQQLTSDNSQAAMSSFVDGGGGSGLPPSSSMDWVLGEHDKKTTIPQSLDEELRRLQVLKSYLILDSDREPEFERLTGLGGRLMDTPICLGKKAISESVCDDSILQQRISSFEAKLLLVVQICNGHCSDLILSMYSIHSLAGGSWEAMVHE